VEAAGNATSSGLVGASFVLQALVLAGRGDIALAMALREEEPSWGHMVKQGPGTIWETWDDTSNSHNHPMFTASIGPYLYSIAGLDPSTWTVPGLLRRRVLQGGAAPGAGGAAVPAGEQAEAAAGEEASAGHDEVTMHVTPDPHAVRVLGRASAAVATMCGQVSVAWRVVPGGSDGRFEMSAVVPHNCGRARLVLHVPDALLDATGAPESALCVGGYRLGGGGEAAAGNALPRNVFRAQLAPGNKTVDVFVGGGRVELALGRCL
jgi:hypothetical protein